MKWSFVYLFLAINAISMSARKVKERFEPIPDGFIMTWAMAKVSENLLPHIFPLKYNCHIYRDWIQRQRCPEYQELIPLRKLFSQI